MYDELIKRLRNGLPCYGEKCLSCSDRKHCVTHYEHEAADAIEELSKRVPVPPHGRLIDADALADSFEPSDFWNSDAEDNCFAAVRIVHSAPTIIPAEEDET